MVLDTCTGNSLPAIPLKAQDAHIADALAAWLAALNVSNQTNTFQQATNQSASLCKVFTIFAPHLLTDRDFFVSTSTSGTTVSRQHRYNTRRLARCLATWFALVPGPPPNSASLPHQDPSEKPPVVLAPAASQTITTLADAARTEDLESVPVLLLLAEVLLCAAVHSSKRELFIKAVLTLSSQQQDALAQSIRRSTVDESKEDSRVLGTAVVNDENIIARNPPITSSQNSSSTRVKLQQDPLSAPRGIPLADYKALAAERDSLRRKLVAAEFEKNKATELTDGLRRSLEEATDNLTAFRTKHDQQEQEMTSKTQALLEAKNKLREAHVSVEEMDLLRAKAAASEQLEASLKRASKRLEDVADMRKANKDLEAQISAFRDNEERMTKHSEYLETQLSSSNQRAQELASLSEKLSSDLEEKEKGLASLKTENAELTASADAANKQLASMFMQNSTASRGDTRTISAVRDDEGDNNSSDGEKGDCTQVVDQCSPIPEIHATSNVREQISDELFNEIGVRMGWDDVVECVRGVMDALKEMDEMGETQEQHSAFGHSQGSNGRLSNGSMSKESMLPLERLSRHSSRSDADSHCPDIGSDSESRMSLLPDFGELDSSLKAASGGKGDEFDYAANHVNVTEIPLVRRRSSQLATIPENREGFEQESSDLSMTESSYDSEYSSDDEDGYEAADETVNVAIPGSVLPAQDGFDRTNMVEPGRDAQAFSPVQPHSPVIAEGLPLHPEAATDDSSKVHAAVCPSPANGVTRTGSLTLSVRSGVSRSPSNSATARSFVRQARSQLRAMHTAIEMMAAERQSCSSVGTLVQQLDSTRQELTLAQTKLHEADTQCNGLRRELSLLLKEIDAMSVKRKMEEEREADVLKEKERLIEHLKESMKIKEEDLSRVNSDLEKASGKIKVLQNSEQELCKKLQEATVIGHAQEVEVARLTSKLESNDNVISRLNIVVEKTDGLTSQISRQRENHLSDIAAAARREKQLAEEARDEAKRVAEKHVSVLEDVRASAAAAMKHSRSPDTPGSRRSSRFYDFWRKLLHRDRAPIDYTMPTSVRPDSVLDTSAVTRNSLRSV